MLKDIKITHKMLFILLIPTLGMFLFSGLKLFSSYRIMKDMRGTQQLVTVAVDAGNLVHELQKERGLSAGFISSRGDKFKNDLTAQRQKSDASRKELQAFIVPNREHLTEVSEPLAAALKLLEELTQTRRAVDGFSLEPKTSFKLYTDLITALQDVVAGVVNSSKNTDIMSSAFAYMAFTNQKESAGQERATVNAAVTAGRFDEEGWQRFIRILANQDQQYRSFTKFADKALLKEYQDRYIPSVQYQKLDALRRIALEKGLTGNFGIRPETWFQESTLKINLMKEFEDRLAANITGIAQKTADGARTDFILSLVLTFLFAGLTFGLALTMLFSITRSLQAVVTMMREIAEGEGDMNRRMEVDRKDELGELSYWFNQFVDKIQENVAKLVASLH